MQVRGLSVCYQSGDKMVRALDRVDLTIGAGEVVGLLGESGSGKSSLATAILRLLPSNANQDTGQVWFERRDLLRFSERELRAIRGARISLVWQDPTLALNPVMAVGHQIAEVLRAHDDLSKKQRWARVLELLSEVGFSNPEEIYRAYAHQLSGGQRQRVAIAQAVACKPALIIADEATSKLDAALQKGILDMLNGLRRRYGTALLLISHDPGILAAYADRIVVMYAGRVIEEGEASTLFAHPKHPYTEALLSLTAPAVSSAKSRLPSLDGEVPDLSEVRTGCCFEPRCGQRLSQCATADPFEISFEDGRVACFKYDESR